MPANRRQFFQAVGSTAAATLGTYAALTEHATAAAGRLGKSRILFNLAGTAAGGIEDAAGGDAFGVVVEEPVDGSGVVPKHLGAIRYNDLDLVVSTGMSTAFYALITSLLDRGDRPFDGALSYLNHQSKEIARLNFTDALIEEFEIPPLEAGSKEPGAFTLKLDLGTSQRMAGDLAVKTVTNGKNWKLNDFHISIDGLNLAKTSQIERLAVTRQISRAGGGIATPLAIPDVILRVSATDAAPIFAWLDQSLGGSPTERNGKIEIIAANQSAVLFTLDLFNLGIYSAALDGGDDGKIPVVVAKMYCERMHFTASPAAIG